MLRLVNTKRLIKVLADNTSELATEQWANATDNGRSGIVDVGIHFMKVRKKWSGMPTANQWIAESSRREKEPRSQIQGNWLPFLEKEFRASVSVYG